MSLEHLDRVRTRQTDQWGLVIVALSLGSWVGVLLIVRGIEAVIGLL